MLTSAAWHRFEAEADRLGLIHRPAGPLPAVADLLQGVSIPDSATHAVLLLQAGGRFWEQLQTLRKLDGELDRHPDPLDTFTKRVERRLAALLDTGFAAAHFPFSAPIDFVSLGERLGAGRRSRLSILLHPEYGPWMAFRMLILVSDPAGFISATPPLGTHPCANCPGHCQSACPAGAFTGPKGEESLDYLQSFQFRRANPAVCEQACAARLACPVGQSYRYPADFLASAHRRAYAVGMAHLEEAGKPAQQPTPQGSLF